VTRDVDLVIVGGGPAGLSTALHARELGDRMVVLEKHRYPRDKICAGGIGARAFRILERIGVTVDCANVPIDVLALRLAGETVTVRQPGLGVVVRRYDFDHAFAKVAIARGIEVRDGCGVERIEIDSDRVVVTTETGDVYRARAVVGADGIGGVVRTQAGFPRGTLRAQVVELDTEAAAGDEPRDTLVFDLATRDLHGYAWDFPTLVAGAPMMCRGAYVLRDDRWRGDAPHTRVAEYLARRGLDPTRYKLKRFAERGFEPGAAIARPRVILVGEAAGIDIATGEGIAQAIEYGSVAGPYLVAALARDDLGFADWRRHVTRHHLGRQLRIRHAMYRAFYGPRRLAFENLVPKIGLLLQAGAQDFAGTPISKLAVARGAVTLFAGLVREGLRT
jgi:flavin-dependent dehydrogenase